MPVGTENRLLATLPREEYDRLLPYLETVSLAFKHSVYERSEPIPYVYFPINGVVSLLIEMQDGATVEVGTVGNEGMVGIPVFLGAHSTPGRAWVQVPGTALRMQADVFREEASQIGPLHRLLHLYVQASFNQIAQSAACNRAHSIEHRCSRWLLMTHDRVGADAFPLTHEFLSQMLGVRRASVTEVAGALQRAGLIRYRRGRMTVVDREGLERTSCECYRTVKDEYDRLLGSPASW